MSIKRLPKSVFSSILSNSAIYSPAAAVKELVENSIDAFGTDSDQASANSVYVEVDRDTGGLDHLLVKDNSSGVPKDSRSLMCLNCTTSKLSKMEDLDGITTCGFRGEALYFISQLGSMEVTTRMKNDAVAEQWSVNQQGLPDSVPRKLAGPVGTTVKVTGLFKSAPVRRRLMKKHHRKTLEEVTEVLSAYALVYRNIRFELRVVNIGSNGKVTSGNSEDCVFVSKVPRKQLMLNVLRLRKSECLFEWNTEIPVRDYQVAIEAVLPRMRAQDEISSSHPIKVLTVNGRPMNLKLKFGRTVARLIHDVYTDSMLLPPPVWYLSLTVPNGKVDVNIEPSKADVLVANELILLEGLRSALEEEVRAEHAVMDPIVTVPEITVINIPVSEAPVAQSVNDPVGIEHRVVDVFSPPSSKQEHHSEPLFIPVNESENLESVYEPQSETQSEAQPEAQTEGQPEAHPDPPDPPESDVELNIQALRSWQDTSVKKPNVQQKLNVTRIPAVTEMSQRTFGHQRETFFKPSRDTPHRRQVIRLEQEWVNREGEPTSLLRYGCADLYSRALHKTIRPSSLEVKSDDDDDGIIKLIV